VELEIENDSGAYGKTKVRIETRRPGSADLHARRPGT
jgi:hypothetical protein